MDRGSLNAMNVGSVNESASPESGPSPVKVAVCVDHDGLDRMGRMLRHLAVGMVDQAVQLRLVSSDPRVDSLTLGPVQTVAHGRLVWPMAGRRLARLYEQLAQQAPMVVHAFSGETYRLAMALAAQFDADAVLQVTSLDDCHRLGRMNYSTVRRFVPVAGPLAAVLTEQLGIEADRVELIRPGMRAVSRISCFSDVHDEATVLSMSPLERGAGVDQLIEATAVLKRKGHGFLLFLLGQGSQETALRRLVREHNLSAAVTFARPRGEPTAAIESTDLFVRPSSDSSFVDDTLYAMSCGAAVVGVAGPVCDHYRHGETALVCERASAEALAAAIEKLITDRAYAQRIATGAIEYVRKNHSISRMAETTAAMYRDLSISRRTFSIR